MSDFVDRLIENYSKNPKFVQDEHAGSEVDVLVRKVASASGKGHSLDSVILGDARQTYLYASPILGLIATGSPGHSSIPSRDKLAREYQSDRIVNRTSDVVKLGTSGLTESDKLAIISKLAYDPDSLSKIILSEKLERNIRQAALKFLLDYPFRGAVIHILRNIINECTDSDIISAANEALGRIERTATHRDEPYPEVNWVDAKIRDRAKRVPTLYYY